MYPSHTILNPDQYSLVFLPGLLAGRLFDLGYFHSLFAACSLLLVVATLLVAECHEYWQLLLCQGFAVGVGAIYLYLFVDVLIQTNCLAGVRRNYEPHNRGTVSLVQEKAEACPGVDGSWLVPWRDRHTHCNQEFTTSRRVCVFQMWSVPSHLIQSHGRFKWTMRIIALILLLGLGLSNLVSLHLFLTTLYSPLIFPVD